MPIARRGRGLLLLHGLLHGLLHRLNRIQRIHHGLSSRDIVRFLRGPRLCLRGLRGLLGIKVGLRVRRTREKEGSE